jgi:hypothetical protein
MSTLATRRSGASFPHGTSGPVVDPHTFFGDPDQGLGLCRRVSRSSDAFASRVCRAAGAPSANDRSTFCASAVPPQTWQGTDGKPVAESA